MSRYPLGQPVTIPITVRDRTSALVDAGTAQTSLPVSFTPSSYLTVAQPEYWVGLS
jgi:hypothetical protein